MDLLLLLLEERFELVCRTSSAMFLQLIDKMRARYQAGLSDCLVKIPLDELSQDTSSGV
jgi:hypothetical protein